MKHGILLTVDACLAKDDSSLNVTRSTFTSNNARRGGAIGTQVGHHMHGLTLLDNRMLHSIAIVLYYNFL